MHPNGSCPFPCSWPTATRRPPRRSYLRSSRQILKVRLSAFRLPPELVPDILGYLDQATLRRAAAVSRLFYDSAWRAGLYLHLNINWHVLHSDPARFATVKDVVNHVRRKGLWFSVSATFQTENSIIAHDILALLFSAFSVLVNLSIYTSSSFFPAVAAVLSHPVPNLAAFKLSVAQLQDDPALHRVPTDLFMGLAPKLRQLALKDVPLGRDPVPAFCHVDTVSLDYAEVYPDIEYAFHFPRLRCMHLMFYSEYEAPPPRSFQLDGVRLRKLTLGACYPYSFMPSMLASTKLEDIPHVVHNGPIEGWSDPLWNRGDDGPFSIRLKHPSFKEQVSISITPDHRSWTRTYHTYTWYTSHAFPVADLPGLSERLAYLRLSNTHIAGLLECDGLELGALRDLRVDFHADAEHATMVWPPDWLTHRDDLDGTFSFSPRDASTPAFAGPSYAHIDCSALQRLTLFAMDAVLRVNSPEVAFLARALSQCARRKLDRASLVLVGVDLDEYEHPLLDDTFSAVCRHDFAGGNSILGRDAGLWGDGFE